MSKGLFTPYRFPCNDKSLTVLNSASQTLDHLFGEHCLCARDETKAVDLSSQCFPGSRIIQRKFPDGHPSDGDTHARTTEQRLLQYFLFCSRQAVNLTIPARCKVRDGTLKKRNASDFRQRSYLAQSSSSAVRK